MIRSVIESWTPRRRLALVALLPLVAAWFLVVARSSSVVPPGPGWYAGAGVAALLGAAVLASYLPASGRRLDLGCTPCATLAGLTLVGATMALRSYGSEPVGPLIAVAVLLFGLTQRMSQPATCATPVRDAS
jgi:hypothetical protein